MSVFDGQIGDAVLPEAIGEIPCGHNVVLVERVKDPAERLWYSIPKLEDAWSGTREKTARNRPSNTRAGSIVSFIAITSVR